MTADPTADLRRTFYALLTAVAVAVAAAKVVGAENVYEPSRYKPPTPQSFGADRDADLVPERVWPATRPEPTPFFSSNDKSRWATVRAIVENGEYVIARRKNFTATTPPFGDEGVIVNRDGKLDSLDIVMNPDTGAFYSSKPPLFPTLVAGGYWILHRAFGLSLDRDRWPVVMIVLFAVNVTPLGVYLWLLSKLVEQYGRTDFGKLFAFTVACVGTYLTTFAGTLNNHSPAAYCVLFAVYPLLRGTGGWAVAGFFAGFAATFELPALAIAVGLFVPLLVVNPRRALLVYLPAAVLPIAAQYACNYAAMGRLKPAYSEFGGPWYEYAGSHWAKLKLAVRPRGIDFNDEPTAVYAFHMLLGHHGWFSLTPAWLVGLVGLAADIRRVRPDLDAIRTRTAARPWTLPLLAGLTAATSVVLFAFYLTRTTSYNYGGSTSGLRWFFWLTPLWVLASLSGADRLGRRGRYVAVALLGLSAVSAFYPAANPWRNPWLLQVCEVTGWVRY